MSSKMGCVSRKRYDEIVTEGRKLVTQKTRVQFRIGELALEIEPLRQRRGSQAGPGEELLTGLGNVVGVRRRYRAGSHDGGGIPVHRSALAA